MSSVVEDRRKKVRRLYLREGLEAPAIAELLLADGTLKSKTAESAARTVRSDVAAIKKEIEETHVEQTSEDEKSLPTGGVAAPLLRKLEKLNRLWEQNREISENEEMITTIMGTPNGEIVMTKPKWPAGVKKDAIKEMRQLAKVIAELELEIEERRRAAIARATGDDGALSGLVIVESDASIDDLIKRNLSEVN